MISPLTMTIEFSKEDRARLDNILSALTALASIASESPSLETVKAAEEFGRGIAESVAAATPEPEEPKTTLADIQGLVRKLAAKGTVWRESVKGIITPYAQRVSEIPEDKFNEVYRQLAELEGKLA